MTEILPARNPAALQRAVTLLQQGQVIALPTDTIYGIGAPAFNKEAVAQIYRLKQRPVHKAIPVFVPTIDSLSRVCQNIPAAVYPLLRRYWPGGLTVVLPASTALPGIVTHHEPTVAVRIPDHPVVKSLLALMGQPLAVTSANLSTQPTPTTAEGIKAQLGPDLPLVLDDGPAAGGIASTIVDFTQVPPRILRRGAVNIEPRFLTP